MKNEVAVFEMTEEKAVALYVGGGINDILVKLKEVEDSFKPDLTTAKGRKEIASMAYKASQLKTTLDNAGKKLNSSKRAEIDVVDSERRKLRDECDATRDRIRKPLTDWEEAEAKRIEDEKEAAELLKAEDEAHQEHSMWLREKEIEKKEAVAEAERVETEHLLAVKVELARVELLERQRKEAEELRIEEARKQAVIDAEESAARQVKEAKEAEEKAILEAEKAQLERDLAAKKAEEDKKQAAIDAEEARKLAVKKAQEDEQQKQREKEETEAAAKAKLEANQKHVSSILKAAKEGIMNTGLPESAAKQIVLAIKNGEIPNVQINY